MKQVVLKERETLIVEEVEDAHILRDNDVLIEVKAVTICGSDISYFKADKLPHDLQYPLVLGHEVAGIVKAVGAGVKNIHVHDRVAIEPGSFCGHCRYCVSGQYNFCESLKFMASKGVDGALKQMIVWPEKCVYKLPDTMTYEEGALLEPLSVAYSAIEKAAFTSTSTVVVLGAGSIGMLIGKLMQVLYPHTCVYLVDQYENKVEMGMEIGLGREQFLIGNSYDLKNQNLFTHIIDTTGNHALAQKFLHHSIQGASLICIGVSDKMLDLTFKEIVYQGLHIIGSYRYANTYPKLLELYREQRLDIRNIITKSFMYNEAQQAFDCAMDTEHNSKVVIRF